MSGLDNTQAGFRKDASAPSCREDPNGHELTFERERVNKRGYPGAKAVSGYASRPTATTSD
jgi:hypothetical protein